jgi:hypothetical protein
LLKRGEGDFRGWLSISKFSLRNLESRRVSSRESIEILAPKKEKNLVLTLKAYYEALAFSCRFWKRNLSVASVPSVAKAFEVFVFRGLFPFLGATYFHNCPGVLSDPDVYYGEGLRGQILPALLSRDIY